MLVEVGGGRGGIAGIAGIAVIGKAKPYHGDTDTES
jgi:hypothetical protein